MNRAYLPLLATGLLLAACTSTNPENEQASAARADASTTRANVAAARAEAAAAARAEAAAVPPPGSSEVLGASSPGTGGATIVTATTPNTTADALRAFSDTEFLLAAASSNEMYIQLGMLAAQQGRSQAVRQYGQMMVDQHTAAIQEQTALNTQLRVQPSTAIMPMHQKLVARLQDQTDADFDRRYLNVMQAAHRLDIEMYEAKDRRAADPAVQALAARRLPTLRDHLAETQTLEKQLK